MSSYKFINSCVPDEKYIILYETFTTNDLCEVKEIMTKNKIVNIMCYCSINLLNNFNFENVLIEKITCGVKLYGPLIENFNNLPESLLVLNLSEYEHTVSKLNNLPMGLKELMLPIGYRYELDNLPISLEYLLVQPNIWSQRNLAHLPEGLKTLVIKIHGDCINFDNLPNGLEKLEIEGILADNVSLENLPRKLKTLHLPNYLYVREEDPNVRERSQYNKPIVNLPQGLEELRVSIEYAYLNETLRTNSEKPIKIKKLIIGHDLSELFTGIRTYKYKTIDFHTIPDYVEELELSDNFNDIIKYIPPGIKKLKFGSSFNKKIKQNVIPDTVEEIEFGYSYNYTMSKYPSNLKVLIFGRNFSSNLTNLPSELMRLELGEKFQAKLTNLPEKLKIIKFNELGEFKDDLKLPENLEILCLSSNYKGKLLNIPKSLRQIKFSANSNPKLLEQLNNANYTGDIIDIQISNI